MAHRPHLRRTLTTPAAPRRQPSPARRAPAAAVAAVLVALGTTACSAGSDSGSSSASGTADSSESAGRAADAPAAAEASGGVDRMSLGASADQRDGSGAAQVGPLARQVIRTGEVTVQRADVQALRDDVGLLVQRYGGYVSSESSSTDDKGRLVRDRLVLRVPSDRYADLLDGFGGIGTVISPTTKAEDVTTEVIDVDSRVQTAEVSVQRLRRFMRQSNDVDTLIRLESEVARREADLASLRAQQDYLDDQTSLATLTVMLQPPPEVAPVDKPADAGFLTGLSGGWEALEGVLVVAVTILGAVLPFGVAAALVGVPVALVLRATRRRRAVTPPPATPASPA